VGRVDAEQRRWRVLNVSRHRGPQVRQRRIRVRALSDGRSTVFVAALSAGLGALMVTGSEAAHRIVELGERTGDSATVAAILPVVAWVFIAVALYVSAVVTSNTCATVVAGQTRAPALQRVLGATGVQLRRQITVVGLACGTRGSLIGVVAGTAVANGAFALAAATSVLPPLGWLLPPASGPIAALVAVITTIAFRIGSRDVLSIPHCERSTRPSNRCPLRSAPGPGVPWRSCASWLVRRASAWRSCSALRA
jgi:hypothetical protein